MNPRLQQRCPRCGAAPGWPCRALNRKAHTEPRSTMHRERRAERTESIEAVLQKMRTAKPEELSKGLVAASPHGSSNRYASGCRCSDCRKARATYEAERRAKLQGTLLPGDPQHGTTTGYATYRCRCDLCRQANRDYVNNLRERTRLAVPGAAAK